MEKSLEGTFLGGCRFCGRGARIKMATDNSMKTVRLMAIGSIVLIGIYLLFRVVATNCAGVACDAYIPVSLLLPILLLVMVAITGLTGTILAWSRPPWFALLLAATLLGVLGPVVALLIFKDQPDILVPSATVLELLAASAALFFSSVAGRTGTPRPAR